MSAPAPVLTSESSAEYLMIAYLELRVQPSMEQLIECWGVNEEGRKDAFDALYKAANDPREEFFEYLEKLFSAEPVAAEGMGAEGRKKIEDLARSKQYLQIFSQCAAGEDPEILRQYCRLSSLREEDSKIEIGNFFKKEMNQFLKERFPDLWKERIGKVRVIANDCDVSAGGGGGSGVVYRPEAVKVASRKSPEPDIS